jgi:hypothetical protein
MRIRIQLITNVDADPDPDPAYHSDAVADPDPTFQFDADPCGSGSPTLILRLTAATLTLYCLRFLAFFPLYKDNGYFLPQIPAQAVHPAVQAQGEAQGASPAY